ncbi:hypothetical protein V1L54_23445 [Streptomyces sp. TRM 70361]|uniref:hypothetical protein n=1 Tax=Streptomyces sp. TRM 70361 TaxID=3116553 RepID=UPI002E7C107E|nr:hypothetical protein [Streptomyces sp. TRM 70361]MEE1942320.1 hypothetical protein [Streptomyces sp. TRM 70361]
MLLLPPAPPSQTHTDLAAASSTTAYVVVTLLLGTPTVVISLLTYLWTRRSHRRDARGDELDQLAAQLQEVFALNLRLKRKPVTDDGLAPLLHWRELLEAAVDRHSALWVPLETVIQRIDEYAKTAMPLADAVTGGDPGTERTPAGLGPREARSLLIHAKQQGYAAAELKTALLEAQQAVKAARKG